MTELRGLAHENGLNFDAVGPDGVKFLKVEHVEATAELMDVSRAGRVQYYVLGVPLNAVLWKK